MSAAHPRLLRHARKALVPLAQNPAHKHAAEFALTHYASGAVYSFIPKNACSTMRVSLAIANGCLAGPEDFAWIHKNNGAFRADLQTLVTAPYTFAILRCPYRRLASAFADKIVSRSSEFWNLHRALGDQLDPDSLTFRGFVEAITPEEIFKSNVHWQPQADFLVYETYDDLFQMEEFATIAPRLKERIGLDLLDARSLTGHGTDHLDRAEGSYADTPCHVLQEMRRQNQAPGYDMFYDTALIAQVAKLYRQDLNLYAANFGSERLLFPPKTSDKD